MAKFSVSFKEQAVKRLLGSDKESASSVASDLNISTNTLYLWRKKYLSDSLVNDGEIPSNRRSIKEKLSLLLMGKAVPADELGKWLRQNGLHSEHLHQFEQEIKDMAVNKSGEIKDELVRMKKELKEKEKQIRKKDKTIAEMAAIITLKKKMAERWGDHEED